MLFPPQSDQRLVSISLTPALAGISANVSWRLVVRQVEGGASFCKRRVLRYEAEMDVSDVESIVMSG